MTNFVQDTAFSVEIQREFDVVAKTWQDRVFVKLYAFARTSGLIAVMGAHRWQTLSVLATYMDPQGNCYPSQDEIARALGVSRSSAAERLRDLLAFRWEGHPLVEACRVRAKTSAGKGGERWASNHYTILPVAGFRIGPLDGSEPMSGQPDTGSEPMSGQPDTGSPDTNKIHPKQEKIVIITSGDTRDTRATGDDDAHPAGEGQKATDEATSLRALVGSLAPKAIPSPEAAHAFIQSHGGLPSALAAVKGAADRHSRTRQRDPIVSWQWFLAATEARPPVPAPPPAIPCEPCRGRGSLFDAHDNLVACEACHGVGLARQVAASAPEKSAHTAGGRA